MMELYRTEKLQESPYPTSATTELALQQPMFRNKDMEIDRKVR
jgi:hypothetical protein